MSDLIRSIEYFNISTGNRLCISEGEGGGLYIELGENGIHIPKEKVPLFINDVHRVAEASKLADDE